MQNNNAGHPPGNIYSIILLRKKPSVCLLLTLHSELKIQSEVANKQPIQNVWRDLQSYTNSRQEKQAELFMRVKMFLEYVCFS